ncbi:hypothetical protein EMCG_01691 [[Emmonsia] crescens]|uniref:Dihydrofolate reductase n=1 Tax=[Emmonsia] crescens TaxID=73230 RepID=A0A0G2I1L3_9EURO|nr:hypothetical protein EMCG_01691 [Emmonsia crescens UAMH 3008]
MPSPLTTSARALLHPLPPLTLIVATTPITTPLSTSNSPSNPSSSPPRPRRRLGIGYANSLPWPRIKTDMTFFSRVTTRASPPPPPTSLPSEIKCISAVNAVIMGRKTYDSLPARFRPLPGRVNVVVTRDGSGKERGRIEGEWRAAKERERERQKKGKEAVNVGNPTASAGGSNTSTPSSTVEEETQPPDVLVANSLESAVTALYDAFRTNPTPGPLSHNSTRHLANIFIIGGGEIYASALNLKLDPAVYGGGGPGVGMRIVMTDVRRCSVPTPSNDATATSTTTAVEKEVVAVENSVNGFECDTFFPIDSDELEGGGEWRRVSSENVSTWVGEEVKEGWVRESEVALRVLGFKKME